MSELAPIVLFVYNRPRHTERTLNSLSKNILAKKSNLFIYCDGPKINEEDQNILSAIRDTRLVVKKENRFKSVKVFCSEVNKGLADSIIDGVSEIVGQYGKIIVLEDDLITSSGFLKYMNDALEMYKDEKKVMHISGYCFPIKNKMPSTFFLKPATCWGWATWENSWIHFKKAPSKQISEIEKIDGWKEFTFNYSYRSYKDQLFQNKSNKINTWAIFWYASIFLKGGICLHPYPSLVQNIGTDGSGKNFKSKSKDFDHFKWAELTENIKVERIQKLIVKKKHNKIVKSFFDHSFKPKLSIRDKLYIIRKSLMGFFK